MDLRYTFFFISKQGYDRVHIVIQSEFIPDDQDSSLRVRV